MTRYSGPMVSITVRQEAALLLMPCSSTMTGPSPSSWRTYRRRSSIVVIAG